MNRLAALIRPRLLLAEGLLLLPTCMALSWVAHRVRAWELSFTGRCAAMRLIDAIEQSTTHRSPLP